LIGDTLNVTLPGFLACFVRHVIEPAIVDAGQILHADASPALAVSRELGIGRVLCFLQGVLEHAPYVLHGIRIRQLLVDQLAVHPYGMVEEMLSDGLLGALDGVTASRLLVVFFLATLRLLLDRRGNLARRLRPNQRRLSFHRFRADRLDDDDVVVQE